jgi:hypothetical protein
VTRRSQICSSKECLENPRQNVYLLRILGVEEKKLADDSICGEVVDLIAEEDDALAKEETEGITGFLPGNHRARANSIHKRGLLRRRKSTRSEGRADELAPRTAARHSRGSLGHRPRDPADGSGTAECHSLGDESLRHKGFYDKSYVELKVRVRGSRLTRCVLGTQRSVAS